MASEPPAKAGANEAEETAPVPTSAEARKAATALSKLDEKEDESAGTGASKADADALGKAMQGLSVTQDTGEKKKVAKVEASDVTLVVSLSYFKMYTKRQILNSHADEGIGFNQEQSYRLA